MNDTNLDVKRKRIETLVKILGLGVVGFFVSPFIFIAIKGLLGLIVAGTIGSGVIYFMPAFASTLANWRLKALKAEASKNPVETLQNDYRRQSEALGKFHDAIQNFVTEKEQFAGKLEGFKAQYPNESARFQQQLDTMEQLLALRITKYKQAQKSLEAYDLEIQKASAIWDMGLAAAKMSKAAGMTQGDFFAKIQRETAIDSVQRNMNSAFADLQVSLMTETKDTPQVTTDEPKQLNDREPDNVTPILNAEPVKIRSRR